MIQKKVDRFRIMSSIQKQFIYSTQGETLLEFDCAHDQTDSVVPESRLQSGVKRKIVFTVRCGNHVQVVPVAETLNVTPNSVKFHVRGLIKIIGGKTGREAAERAKRNGIDG